MTQEREFGPLELGQLLKLLDLFIVDSNNYSYSTIQIAQNLGVQLGRDMSRQQGVRPHPLVEQFDKAADKAQKDLDRAIRKYGKTLFDQVANSRKLYVPPSSKELLNEAASKKRIR